MKSKQVVKGNRNNLFNNQGSGDQVINLGVNPVPNAKQISSKPLPIFGQPFKIKWLLISSIITIIADLLTVILGFEQIFTHSPTHYLFLGLCLLFMLSWGLYTLFSSGALIRLGGKNVVARDGILKEGTYDFSPCPKCGGRLFLTYNKQLSTILRCAIYPYLPDHCFALSSKLFDPYAYPDKNKSL